MAPSPKRVLGVHPAAGSDVDELHSWFRARGLPTLVPMRAWGRGLAYRVAPAVVFFAIAIPVAIVAAATGLDEAAQIATEENISQNILLVTAALLTMIGLALAVLAYVGVRQALHRLAPRTGRITAWVLILFATVLLGTVDLPGVGVSVKGWVLTLVCCLGVAWSGIGAFVTWAARAALRHLGAVTQMASFAVPVILMLVIFAFFSAEIWQLTAYLSWSRLAAYAGAIAVLALLVVLRVSATEVTRMREELTPEYRAQLLVGTPGAAAWRKEATRKQLSRLQQVNMLLVMSVAQLVLGGFFALTQAGLLMVLGKLTLTTDTMRLYVGEGTTDHPIALETLTIGGNDLPITINLIKTSIFLGLLAALSFVVSSVSESRYRAEFFDPILTELHQAVAVFDAAQARSPRATRATNPPTPPEPADPPESPRENS